MRHYLLSLFVAAFFAATLSPAMAQVPRILSYQGVVLNPTSGIPISDGQHNIQIKLYDSFNAVSPLYTENQTGVNFTKGNFAVMIGSITAIPNSLTFDKGYFLGVSVDGGAEMAPRTPLSPAPYAIRASVADGLSPAATGVVTSLNNKSGAVTLAAGTGTILTNSGSTITISSTGTGGTGIQGVQGADNSIVVANPTGPVASLAVGLGGITTTKIADGAVTPIKIDGSGAQSGMVLTANGLGSTSWVTPTVGGSLTLPFSGSISNANAAFAVVNTGTGSAGLFTNSDVASNAFALDGVSAGAANSIAVHGQNTGSGRGGFFEVTNANSGATGLTGKTQGTGNAVDISIANNANSADALHTITTGVGRAAFFSVSNSSPTAPALEVVSSSTTNGSLGILSTLTNSSSGSSSVAAAIKGDHQGSTGIGMGVWGRHAGTGVGVFGSVNGNGGYGVAGTAFGQNSTGMLATYAGSANAGIALEMNNGFMKVSGNNKTAYIHTTTVANADANNTNSTILSYAGMTQTDMVIVTHVKQTNRFNNGYGVWWNQTNNSWEIFLETVPAAVMPVGEEFNVLVIKQ